MSFLPIKAFYNELITNEHCTGDIWTNLPTHGLLKASHLPGVVVTPACDLANEKVETITYLPIISIPTYLATTSFLSEIKGTLLGLSDQLEYGAYRTITELSWPPHENDIARMLSDMQKISNEDKQKKLCHRLTSLLNHLGIVVTNKMMSADMKCLSEGIGDKAFEKILRKIVTNSYRSDIHFLPTDGQDPTWSVVTTYSLALFRYPLTAPIEIFDLAQTTWHSSWHDEVVSISKDIPYAEAFDALRPIKTLRISPSFLHDMLIRFVGLYARLGSPDFTPYAIDKIIDELKR